MNPHWAVFIRPNSRITPTLFSSYEGRVPIAPSWTGTRLGALCRVGLENIPATSQPPYCGTCILCHRNELVLASELLKGIAEGGFYDHLRFPIDRSCREAGLA
jgi:hypothetical protein